MNTHDLILQDMERELERLTSTSIGRRAFLATVPLLLAGCASTSRHRYREGDNRGQETSITVEDEKRMAKQYLPEMTKAYPPLEDKELQDYVGGIGNRIVVSNNLNNNPYQYNFTVVHTDMVNAFALPAGSIFVTAPLIKMCESEAELAGVIGHEIGHVKARHAAERIEEQKKEGVKSILYGLGGAILGGAAGYGLGKVICKKNDKDCMERVAKYGAIAGAAGGLLIQKFAFLANSREDEMEADRVGFKTAVNAGYHKDHVGTFYNRLLDMEKKASKKEKSPLLASLSDALSTHPPSEERVIQMTELASNAVNVGKTITTREFKKRQKGL